MPKAIEATGLDLQNLCREAFDFLFQEKKKRRNGESTMFGGQDYYTTSQELERQVREFVEADLLGEERGKYGQAMGARTRNVRVEGLKDFGGLREFCRWWLRRQPDIESHNFGKSTTTGERFRPKGDPLSPQEEKRLKEQNKPKPVHMVGPQGYRGPVLCVARSGKKVTRRHSPRRSPSQAKRTQDSDKVTCPRCKRKLGA